MNNLSINYEWYDIRNSNYLLIHKNGCSTIRKNFDMNRIDSPSEYKFRWTTIRSPMERFISGLAYDIGRTKYVNVERLKKNPEELLFGEHNDFGIDAGMSTHTYMQSLYFLNEKINMFVKMEDLKDFIELHNREYISEGENKTTEEEKQIAQEIVSGIDKQRLDDLFYIENKIYNKIIHSEFIWNWRYGKIL